MRLGAKPEATIMRQIWITKAGPPEVLEVKEAPDPEPKAGEVRVRVEASGINFADILGRLGLYPDLPPMPVVPGYEVAGRVDAAGADVAGSWVGRDVFTLTQFGGYSDTICVPATQVFERPAGMSAAEAAAIPVNYFTAWQLLVVMGALKPNETVLVHSVGGGVGIAATPASSERRPQPSMPRCGPWASTILLTTVRRISKRGCAKSPAAVAWNSSSMRSVASHGKRDTACSRPRGGSACSAFPRRQVARSEASSA